MRTIIGDYPQALAAFGKNLAPTDHDLVWMAATHSALGNKEQAQQAARKAIAIEPANKIAMNPEIGNYQDETLGDLFRQRIMTAGIPVA
uniref:Tetratricopeptide repeat protein n=1 Tax=uncultured Thiotrichaceae bacterium TaxID=298394 RepID=A0A6S6T034_9GAMM|nr:MAG: Unknown protein [uncultured Thiotrichaceae bacterium]